ncbi:MAG: Gfo/Idh/MocA family oxidoreductase [Planctomycetes bacterium]|nr:Gfo/Idh/MocA family oxidoreductase [Planctomycetota bacterium]
MKKLRIGIVGAGGRGIHCFGAMLLKRPEECELVALADPNRPRMEGGLEYLKYKCDLYEDPKAMLARKDIDAAVITTPDYLHAPMAVAALKAGKHIFVDKPLATTTDGCLQILDAARKARRLVYMGFNMRFDPVVQKTKTLVDSGALGKVFSILAHECYDGGKTYMARWNRFKKFGGGLFVHKGSHDLDVVNWLMGAKPVRVSAFANVSVLKPEGLPFALKKGETYGPSCTECAQRERCPDRWSRGDQMYGERAIKVDGYVRDTCIYQSEKDTHDQGMVIVEFEDGQTACHSEYFVTSITNRIYTVLGDRGTCVSDLHANKITVNPRWSQDVIEHRVGRGAGGHGGADPTMVKNFLACLRCDEEPLSSPVDGVWAVAVGQAAEISRAEKRVVEIKELLNPKNKLLAG